MGAKARTSPPTRRPPKPRKGTARAAMMGDEFTIRVWCSFMQVGASAAGFIHDINPATVYRYVADVNGDPSLLERAKAFLKAQQLATEERNAALVDAARELLLARIREGAVVSRHLVALVGLTMPTGRPGGRASTELEVPRILAEPREDPDEAPPTADADEPESGG